MPSVNYTFEDYVQHLDALQGLHDLYSAEGNVIYCGDMNVDIDNEIQTHRNRVQSYKQFLSINNLKLCETSGEKYTFRPTQKTLDYIIVSKSQYDIVKSCHVFDDACCSVSDHLPILTKCVLPLTHIYVSHTPYVAWSKCKPDNLLAYANLLNTMLSELDISNLSYTIDNIEHLYRHVVTCIKHCSDMLLPISKFNNHVKPYWNTDVKAAYKRQKTERLKWLQQGKPRGRENVFFTNYKAAKRIFINAQKNAISDVNKKYYDDLNETAECDMRLFWSLIKRRKGKRSNPVNEISRGDHLTREPAEIAQTFRDYYANVFTPKNNERFDNIFLNNLDESVRMFEESDDYSEDDILTNEITMNELKDCFRDMKCRKAPGLDSITTEHIIHGGETLASYLLKLFNIMLECNYIPGACKSGVIIPIHKEGKLRTEPKSYRPITLLPVIYKLFERVLHHRLTTWTASKQLKFPSAQQNAYQKHLGPVTASFNLQEAVLSYTESNSSVYAAFLDTAGAFDNVRHSAIIMKMHNLGIKGKFLRLIINSYKDIFGCVTVNGVTSDIFPVLQGIRQGGIMSTWSYLLFIDELLQNLESCKHGIITGNIACGNPTLADDLTLLSPSLTSLENQLAIVNTYANTWGYEFNYSKCCVLKFGGKISDNIFQANFGHSEISSCDTVVHVGIKLNKTLSVTDTIDQRIHKGQSSLFSILSLENNVGDINPLTLASLVKKVSFSTFLYGAELWHNISNTDIVKIQRFERLAAKQIQHLPQSTRTDMALSTLGWFTIEADIDQRKLTFLQKLCTIPTHYLSRKLFNYRLNLFVMKGYCNQRGFVPEICRLLYKYGLFHFISDYMKHAHFPCKYSWKNTIKKAITHTQNNMWQQRINSDRDFDRFIAVHQSVTPLHLWLFSNTNSEIKHAISATKILLYRQFYTSYSCTKCLQETSDINRHILAECDTYTRERTRFTDSIDQKFSSEVCSYFLRINSEAFLRGLFDSNLLAVFGINPELQKGFTNLCCKYVHDLTMEYKK